MATMMGEEEEGRRVSQRLVERRQVDEDEENVVDDDDDDGSGADGEEILVSLVVGGILGSAPLIAILPPLVVDPVAKVAVAAEAATEDSSAVVASNLTTNQLASFIRTNIGTLYTDGQYMTTLQDRTNHNKEYANTKEKIYHRFMDTIRAHSRLCFLAELKVDPESPDKQVEEVILVCRGTPSDSKKEILNACLKVFDQSLYKKKELADENIDVNTLDPAEKAKHEYQPNTLNTMHKQLFALLKQKGVLIEQHMFNNFPGSYKLYMKDRISNAVEHRPEYGRLPNQAPVDLFEKEKLRTYAWNLDLFPECQEIFLHMVATIYMLRGSKEVYSCRFSDLQLSIKEAGPFAGERCLEILPLQQQKAGGLDLDNPSCRDEKGFHDMIETPGDKLCVIQLYNRYKRFFPPEYQGPCFVHPKFEKVLKKERRENSIRSKAGQKPNPIYLPDITRPFGKNHPSEICSRVARKCGLKDSRGRKNIRFTANSRRRTGITQLTSSKVEVPSSEVELAGRHKSATTNTGYQEANEEAHARRYGALMHVDPNQVDPSVPKKKKKKKRMSAPAMMQTAVAPPMYPNQYQQYPPPMPYHQYPPPMYGYPPMQYGYPPMHHPMMHHRPPQTVDPQYEEFLRWKQQQQNQQPPPAAQNWNRHATAPQFRLPVNVDSSSSSEEESDSDDDV